MDTVGTAWEAWSMKEKPPKDQKLVCMVDKNLRAGLEALSQKTGAPISELIRRALAKYLEKRKK